jgi:hypothetical protein
MPRKRNAWNDVLEIVFLEEVLWENVPIDQQSEHEKLILNVWQLDREQSGNQWQYVWCESEILY